MRIDHVIAILVALTLVSAPLPAGATQQTSMELRGTIVSLRTAQNSVLVRQRGVSPARFWTVKRHAKTRVIVAGRLTSFSQLRVGDLVKAKGRVTGTRQILADEIGIEGREQATSPPVVLRPPTGQIQVPALGDILKITQPPEIIRPSGGAVITASEFTIVGRTAPGAQVHIEVVTRYIVFDLPAASADVTADGRGIFAHTVRPVTRLSGATYRISAKARLFGFESPTATVTVTQR